VYRRVRSRRGTNESSKDRPEFDPVLAEFCAD
jgi:hypothetical protein